jgi:hypothetical protein
MSRDAKPMRCDEFDNVVYDLARDGLMDAAAQETAVSHARSCDSCGSRLAAERYLNEALAMTAAGETESAPAPVKLALLQAFAARERTAPAGPIPSARPVRRRLYTVAAAAVLAIVSMISLEIIVRRPPPAPTGQVSLGVTTEPPPPGLQAPSQKPNKGSKSSKGLSKIVRGGPKVPAGSRQPSDSTVASSDSDALTDFIPLTHLSSSTAIESGQVIRVKVPLSAFLALGLPVSPEHADELVNAEVVVGDDGVKRAVRLVR